MSEKRTEQVLNVIGLTRELMRAELTAAILDAERIKLGMPSAKLTQELTPAKWLGRQVQELKDHASGIMQRLVTEIDK